MNNRPEEIQKVILQAYKVLEPHFEGIASNLENQMELSYFLTGLENRIAIMIGLKMSKLKLEKRKLNE